MANESWRAGYNSVADAIAALAVDPATVTAMINAAISAFAATLAPIATSGSASDLGAGTVPAGRMPALTGDVTSSAGTVATTVANVPTAATPALTGDVTKSAGSAATTLAAGSASNLNSGTLPAGRMPALTGDVTTSAGAVATTLAAGNAGNLNSGTLAAARMPALTGDVTTSAGAVATTVANVPATATRARVIDTLAVHNSNFATSLSMSSDDSDYEFKGAIVCDGGSNTLSIELNTTTTSWEAVRFGEGVTLPNTSPTAIGSGQQSNTIDSGLANAEELKFLCRIIQVAGFHRDVILDIYDTTGSVRNSYRVRYSWNVTTVITGFRFHSNVTNGIAVGSVIEGRRI